MSTGHASASSGIQRGDLDAFFGLFLNNLIDILLLTNLCLLYTSPSPRDLSTSRMPSSA